MTTTETRPSPDRALLRRLPRLNMKLSGIQTAVGLIASVLSIVGAVHAMANYFTAAPGRGGLVAVIVDGKTDKAVSEATVEILALNNAVVTTQVSGYFGRASTTLAEGQYRVRVSHPKYGAEERTVLVLSGQSAEVRVRLRAGISTPLREAERVVGAGISAVKRLFGD